MAEDVRQNMGDTQWACVGADDNRHSNGNQRSATLATGWTKYSPATVESDYIQNNYQLPQTSVAQFCNLLNASRQFTKAHPATVI